MYVYIYMCVYGSEICAIFKLNMYMRMCNDLVCIQINNINKKKLLQIYIEISEIPTYLLTVLII